MKLIFLVLIALISFVAAFPLSKRVAVTLPFFEKLQNERVEFDVENELDETIGKPYFYYLILGLSCTCTYQSKVQLRKIEILGHTNIKYGPNFVGLTAPNGSSMVCDIALPSHDGNWYGYKGFKLTERAIYRIQPGRIAQTL